MHLSDEDTEIAHRWFTNSFQQISVVYCPSQGSRPWGWFTFPAPGRGRRQNHIDRTRIGEFSKEGAKQCFDKHFRDKCPDGAHGFSLYEDQRTIHPGSSTRVFLNNPRQEESRSWKSLLPIMIDKCREFEAEQVARELWKNANRGSYGKKDGLSTTINGLSTRPNKLNDTAVRALYAQLDIICQGTAGQFSFRRPNSAKQTVTITAKNRTDLLQSFGDGTVLFDELSKINGHRATYVGCHGSQEGLLCNIIKRSMQEYGQQTHGTLTRLFEVPGLAAKLKSIHVIYMFMESMSKSSEDQVERRITDLLQTNPLAEDRVGYKPLKTLWGDYGHQSKKGEGNLGVYIVMPNAAFVDACNLLFLQGGPLSRTKDGIPYAGNYAGMNKDALMREQTKLRGDLARMQPSLAALQ